MSVPHPLTPAKAGMSGENGGEVLSKPRPSATPLDPTSLRRDRSSVQSALTYAIVPVGPADAAQLARVHVQAWRESYRGLLPEDYLRRLSAPLHARRWRARLLRLDEITLAAESQDGALVAYASGQAAREAHGPFEGEITTLYVLRAAQRIGLGRALMTGVARALADRGAHSLVVWVLRDNRRARDFYEGLGGAPAGERDEMVGGTLAPTVGYRWTDIRKLTEG